MPQKTVDHHSLRVTNLLRHDASSGGRIPFANGFEERLVAMHGVVAMRLEEHTELDYSLTLDEQLVDQGGEAGVATCLRDGRVERPVSHVELAH